MVYNFTQFLGNEFTNAIYYCYSFAYSFEFVVRNRLSLFSDFEDLWSSFMFNLLSNSVSIKNIGVNLNNYLKDETIAGRGPLAAGEIAKIFRLVLNFQSKNTMGYEDKNQTKKEIMLQ